MVDRMMKILTTFAFILGSLHFSCAHAQSVKKMEDIANRARSLEEFLSKPAWVNEYSYAVQDYFGKDRFQCESFKKIIKTIRRLAEKVPGFKEQLWVKAEALNIRIPVENMRPKKGKEFTQPVYDLRRLPRPFHGLFNYVSPTGCTRKECDALDQNAPDRWSIALAAASQYVVEEGGRFLGSAVLIVPLKRQSDIYGLVSINGTPVLSKKVAIVDPNSGRVRWQKLFSLWLDEIKQYTPMQWRGLVMLDAASQSAKQIRELNDSRQSSALGSSVEFGPTDPMAEQIAQQYPHRCLTRTNRKIASKNQDLNLLFGVGLDPKNILLVVSSGTEARNASIQSPSESKELLKRSLQSVDLDNPSQLSKFIVDSGPDLLGWLAELLANDADPDVRKKAAMTIRVTNRENAGNDGGGERAGGRIPDEVRRQLAGAANHDVSPDVRKEAKQTLQAVEPKADPTATKKENLNGKPSLDSQKPLVFTENKENPAVASSGPHNDTGRSKKDKPSTQPAPPLDQNLLERVRAGDATAAGLIGNEVQQRIRRGTDRIPLDRKTTSQYLAAFDDGIKRNPELREMFNNTAREVYLYNDDPKATLEALWENRNLPIVHDLLQNMTKTKPRCGRTG